MKPIVSIVIPCHNHRAALWDCLRSISQLAGAWSYEVIVVDDSSTDQPEVACAHWGYRCLRVEARNANIARNVGSAAAQGEYILFFDADNIILPNFLTATVPLLQADRADVVYGRREAIGSQGVGRDLYDAHNQYPVTLASLQMAPQIDSCCLARRQILPEKPWDEALVRQQDWDFHLTLLEQGVRYHFVDAVLYQYRFAPLQTGNEYRSVVEQVPSINRVRSKHQLATQARAVVTIGIFLEGRYGAIEAVLAAVRALVYPRERLCILFLDGSNDRVFFERWVRPFICAYQSEYHALGCVMLYRAAASPNRFEQAESWRVLARHLTTPYVLWWDETVLVPPDTLTRLLDVLALHPKAQLAQGVSRRLDARYALEAWQWRADGGLANLFYAQQSAGVTSVGVGGLSGVLARSEWFAAYPCTGEIQLPHGESGGLAELCGYDLRAAGWAWLQDWSVRYQRILLTDRGERFVVSLESYQEPVHVWPERAMEYVPADENSVSPLLLATRPIILVLWSLGDAVSAEQFLAKSQLHPDEVYLCSAASPLSLTLNRLLHEDLRSKYVVVARADIQPPANLRLQLLCQVNASAPVWVAPLKDQLYMNRGELRTSAGADAIIWPQLDFTLLFAGGVVWPRLDVALCDPLVWSFDWAYQLGQSLSSSPVMSMPYFASARPATWSYLFQTVPTRYWAAIGWLHRRHITYLKKRVPPRYWLAWLRGFLSV